MLYKWDLNIKVVQLLAQIIFKKMLVYSFKTTHLKKTV